jgi:hypothetical protein
MIRRGLTAFLLLLLLQATVFAQSTAPGQGALPHTTTPGVQPQNPLVPTPGFGNPIARPQSLAPTPDICGAGSQSVRVCNNDFQSCSSACTAALLSDTTADITGCTLRCCTGFNACLSIRGCATGTVNCF